MVGYININGWISDEYMKIGFLGPLGTFTEEAASLIQGSRVAFDTISEIFDAVETKKVDMGVIPIENSIEGSLGLTLDLLVHQYSLKIKREIILPINLNLLLNPDADLEDIKVVYSHDQPLLQCRKFLENLGTTTQATPSTAAAAEMILGHKNAAAIGTSRAAELYGLKIAAENIQDHQNNMTRFVVVGYEDHPPTMMDKTSIVFYIDQDRPGGLYEILGVFAQAEINLTKIESRPSKEKLGNYIFFVDFEGHREDRKIQNVLNKIRSKVAYLKILGSYPREGDD
jgi:prephenate dehydratase